MAIFNKYLGFRGRSLTTAITIVSGLTFVAFGYGQADIGGLATVESFRAYFPQIDYVGTLNNPNRQVAIEQGIVVATWNIGCFVAALIAIVVGDKLGRRGTLMLGITFLAIGKTIQAASFSYPQYIVGRFIAGFGNGFNTSTAPAWQAECTKAHRRGRMLMVSSGACIALGVALAYWIDFALAWAQPSAVSWRFPIAGQIIWILPCFFLLPHLPESPRWLILKGRENEALDVLSALNDLHPSHQHVRAEFLQVKDAILQMASGTPKDAFTMGDYRYLHRIILAVALQCMQQFTGINLFVQYLGEMFVGQANLTPWVARLLSACASTEFLAVSFVSVIGIDRFWGRRTLTMFGSTGMCVTMIVLAIAKAIDNDPARIVVAVCMFVFVSFFAIGWQGVAWLWAVELIPLPVRGPANALATSANWLSNFLVVLVAPICFATIGWRTYVIFAATNLVTAPAIYLFYPETGCRSLEEVDVLFHVASRTSHPWWNIRDVAVMEPLWYGKNGRKPFEYERSEWHMRFARLSSEEEGEESAGSDSLGVEAEKGGAGGMDREGGPYTSSA
ncbi:High-affinity glucose transporter [Sphaceloma murrayae]|uniref:High-affinity glucose transporter n=1 Tax=Sphaceloma murrayae TaxID=2082308 RepID=A0A2K1QYR6_9PEZI|nr:High-affinity glucose transporter [Sphaceloma murrayae]